MYISLFFFVQPHLMAGRRLCSGKFLVPEQCYKGHFHTKEEVVNVSESDMATAALGKKPNETLLTK